MLGVYMICKAKSVSVARTDMANIWQHPQRTQLGRHRVRPGWCDSVPGLATPRHFSRRTVLNGPLTPATISTSSVPVSCGNHLHHANLLGHSLIFDLDLIEDPCGRQAGTGCLQSQNRFWRFLFPILTVTTLILARMKSIA